MHRHIGARAGGHFEATCERTVLRGCRACGAPHPLVSHKVDAPECPACGAPVPAPERFVDDAVVTGAEFPWLARLLLAIARWLTRLSKGLEP